MKAEVIRVFDNNGTKVVEQRLWLNDVADWCYAHDDYGYEEANFQANCAITYEDGVTFDLNLLPRDWCVKVVTEEK